MRRADILILAQSRRKYNADAETLATGDPRDVRHVPRSANVITSMISEIRRLLLVERYWEVCCWLSAIRIPAAG